MEIINVSVIYIFNIRLMSTWVFLNFGNEYTGRLYSYLLTCSGLVGILLLKNLNTFIAYYLDNNFFYPNLILGSSHIILNFFFIIMIKFKLFQ